MRFLVDRAIDGAKAAPRQSGVSAGVRRLSGPERQQPAGQSDRDRAERRRLPRRDVVHRREHGRPCQRGDLLVAYTSPGQRVVYVCGSKFVHPLFRLDQRLAELLIIHELLHSLGLGENPPTPGQITKQVTTALQPVSSRDSGTQTRGASHDIRFVRSASAPAAR